MNGAAAGQCCLAEDIAFHKLLILILDSIKSINLGLLCKVSLILLLQYMTAGGKRMRYFLVT